jgi:hypothetical protein
MQCIYYGVLWGNVAAGGALAAAPAEFVAASPLLDDLGGESPKDGIPKFEFDGRASRRTGFHMVNPEWLLMLRHEKEPVGFELLALLGVWFPPAEVED